MAAMSSRVGALDAGSRRLSRDPRVWRDAALVPFLLRLVTGCGGTETEGPSIDAGNGADSTAMVTTAVDGATDDGGVSCYIVASHYGQSCRVDTDCVSSAGPFPVLTGDYCEALCLCGGSDAINRQSVTQYVADVKKTPLGSGAIPSLTCNCGNPSDPCCRGGLCTLSCPTEGLADAGGDEDTVPDGSVLCSNEGPVDAAAPDAGPIRLCRAPSVCTTVNGAWACCFSANS